VLLTNSNENGWVMSNEDRRYRNSGIDFVSRCDTFNYRRGIERKTKIANSSHHLSSESPSEFIRFQRLLLRCVLLFPPFLFRRVFLRAKSFTSFFLCDMFFFGSVRFSPFSLRQSPPRESCAREA